MKRKKILLTLLFSILASGAFAQKILVSQDVIDCGQVVYRKPVVAEFNLKNKSGSHLVIDDVRTSCGCTSVDYPKTSIEGGADFKVRATYDARQMGHFEKQVGIYANGSKTPVMLTLRGVVVEEVVDFVGNYPFLVGDIRTDANDIEFDDVNKGERPYRKIHIMNTTNRVIQPILMHLPNYLSSKVSPSTIAPGHSGVATITLDSRKLRDFGLTQTSVFLGSYLGDKVSGEKEISVSSVLLPRFEDMSDADINEAPSIKMSTTTINLGEFNGKRKLKGEVLVQNLGKSRLDIRSLQMFTSGMQVSLSKSKLAAGETAKLKLTVTEDIKRARQKPRVLMITNDPKNSKVVINVVAK